MCMAGMIELDAIDDILQRDSPSSVLALSNPEGRRFGHTVFTNIYPLYISICSKRRMRGGRRSCRFMEACKMDCILKMDWLYHLYA